MSYLPSTPQLTVPTKLSVAAVSLTVGLLGAYCFRTSVAPQEAVAAAPSAAESIFQHRDSLTVSPVSPRLNPTDVVAVEPPPFVTAEVKKYAAAPPTEPPAELPANLPPQPPTARAIDTVAVDTVAKPAALSPSPDWGGNSDTPLPSSVPEAPPKPAPVVTPPPAVPAVPSSAPVVPREQKTARNKNTQPPPSESDGGLVSISTLPMTTLPTPRIASQSPSASGSTVSPNGLLVPLESLGTPRASRGGAGDSAIVPIPHLSPYAE